MIPLIEFEGVTRPLLRDMDAEGVIRPEKEGVIRPLRDEATDDGLKVRATVGGDNLVKATKTPQLLGHVKYRFPLTDPSFFPFPAKPPLSSTPAHRPGFPSISPIYLRVPS